MELKGRNQSQNLIKLPFLDSKKHLTYFNTSDTGM